jgi:hypothetical protein
LQDMVEPVGVLYFTGSYKDVSGIVFSFCLVLRKRPGDQDIRN